MLAVYLTSRSTSPLHSSIGGLPSVSRGLPVAKGGHRDEQRPSILPKENKTFNVSKRSNFYVLVVRSKAVLPQLKLCAAVQMTATEDTRKRDEDASQQQPREETGEESRESRNATLPASLAAPAAPAAPPIATRALTNRGNPVLFATMLDLRAVCRLSLVSRGTRNTYGRRARKACLTEGGGVPEDCRVEFWKCALNVEKVGCVVCVFFSGLGLAFITYSQFNMIHYSCTNITALNTFVRVSYILPGTYAPGTYAPGTNRMSTFTLQMLRTAAFCGIDRHPRVWALMVPDLPGMDMPYLWQRAVNSCCLYYSDWSAVWLKNGVMFYHGTHVLPCSRAVRVEPAAAAV